jgi:LPXTG-motif cell wall-anchored protein
VDAAQAGSYLGAYDVTAHVGDEDDPLTGSFRVVADDDAPGGGGDGDDSGEGGSGDGDSLPRTGGGTAGALTVGLVLTGIGLVLLLRTRRPRA